MRKLSKRQKQIREILGEQGSDPLSLEDAITTLQKVKATKFDETVDVVLRLGVDPRKADQMVRGTCSLPHGLGKEVRILVFAKGEKAKEAEDAGADYVGAEDMAEKIQKENWFEFERVVATPDVMNVVGRLGKILGPRGLMPNPKVGTVTMDVAGVVKEIKAGQVEFRVDKHGNLHAPMGKISFDSTKLCENIRAFVDTVQRLKPSTAKGVYLRKCSLSSTMGPGLTVNL